LADIVPAAEARGRQQAEQERPLLSITRIYELLDEFGITETDVLKHRLEDHQRWRRDIVEVGSACAAEESQMTGNVWIVLVGEGSFQKCYGTFDSYDAAVDWLRENQFAPAECGIHPVNGYDDVRKT